ncbi:toxin-antitoxin system YwqK family antitoxin [Paenibacillus sp. FSL R10-2736]|uniref:toxin-antitoxin system YwqK family antitoxin n=1 Tax=Paenibacillus sp. FSL R10-2736 TaxID=2954692 RepID=UPI0030FB7553
MILLFFALFSLSITLLLIGLIKPTYVIRWGKRRTRKHAVFLYGVIGLSMIIGMVVLPVEPENNIQAPQEVSSPATVVNDQTDVDPSKVATNDKTISQSVSPSPNISENQTNKIQLKQKVYSEPTYYQGATNKEGLPEGYGKITYVVNEEYVLYEGEFINGLYDGLGTLYLLGSSEIEFSGLFHNGERMFYPYENEFYFDKGKISFKGEESKTKSGKIMTVFYTGGNTYYIGEWKNKQINGKGAIFYNRYPQVKLSEGIYVNGELDGKGKTYHENGTLKSQGTFKNGKLNGEGKTYYSNGELETEGQYKDGALTGKAKTYHENGNPDADGNFEDGRPMGKIRLYHENGNLAFEGSFDEGILKPYGIYGKGKLYHENGEVMYEGEFKAGKYDGEGTLYNDSGEVIQKGQWQAGNFIN